MGRKELLAELGGPDAVLQLAPGVDLAGLQIDAIAGFLLSRLGPATTLRQVCQLSPLGEEQTLRLLAPLARQGVIRSAGPPKRPARAGAPAPPPVRNPAQRQPSRPPDGGIQAPLWLHRPERSGKDEPDRAGQRLPDSRTATQQRSTSPSVAERLAQRRRDRKGGRWGAAAAAAQDDPRRPRARRAAKAEASRKGVVEETPLPRGRVTLDDQDWTAHRAERASPPEVRPSAGAAFSPPVSSSAPLPPPAQESSGRRHSPRPTGRGGPVQGRPSTPATRQPVTPGHRGGGQRDLPSAAETGHAPSSPLAPDTGQGDAKVPLDPYRTGTPFVVDTPPPRTLEQLAAKATDLDAEALAEKVDIPDEVKRQILYLHGRLDQLDYYRLLAVEREADRKALKRAFRARTKMFHPDRCFRRATGSFGERLSELYKVVSQAYDVLCDPPKRRLYDLTLRQIEEAADGKRSVSRTLHAERLYQEAKRLLKVGDYEAAEAALSQACELEPQEERYRAQLHRVRVLFQRMAATASYGRALPALRAGSWGDAIGPLRETVALLPEPEVLLVLAHCIEQSGGDVRESRAVARRALDINPQLVAAALRISHYEELLSNLEGARDVLQPFLRHPQERDAVRARVEQLTRRR